MNEFRHTQKLMGSVFELVVAHEDRATAEKFIQLGIDEIERIEDLLSEFRNHTATSLINNYAGKQPVAVSGEVYHLIERSIRISNLTQGAFDITVGPLKKLYNFKNEKIALPESDVIHTTLKKVGFHKLQLFPDNQEIFLQEEGMHISFAAIGKGYAADCVKKIWQQKGLKSGVISASGDLTTLGHNSNDQPWTIGIADPDKTSQMLFYIPVTNASVATSGDYVQHFIYNNERYSHNINPITGYPIKGIKSVTVVSPSAELSDALATAVYVMGVEAGLYFINQLPNTFCIIIDADNQSHFSKKVELLHNN